MVSLRTVSSSFRAVKWATAWQVDDTGCWPLPQRVGAASQTWSVWVLDEGWEFDGFEIA